MDFYGADAPLDLLEADFYLREAKAAAARQRDPNAIDDDDEIERRWLRVPEGVQLLARRDALLNALIRIYATWRPRGLEWLAKSYLSAGWERVQKMLEEMGAEVRWRELWPEWKDPARGAAIDHLLIAEQAAQCIGVAAHILEGQTRIYSKWLALRRRRL